MRQGKRIAVASNSHKAVDNLLCAVLDRATDAGESISIAKKGGDPVTGIYSGRIYHAERNDDVQLFTASVVGGTAWLFSRVDFDTSFDYLFVDEAGQVSVANIVAMAIADEISIAHGDFRLGNLMIDRTAPQIIGVLDWELATLGHPLADLAYCCLPWRLPPDLHGIAGLEVPGMPTEGAFVADYCAAVGRENAPQLEFFIVFSLYRWAAIVAGVYRRALDGNAADARALEAGGRFRRLAEAGLRIAQS